jgi:hypothetical protein
MSAPGCGPLAAPLLSYLSWPRSMLHGPGDRGLQVRPLARAVAEPAGTPRQCGGIVAVADDERRHPEPVQGLDDPEPVTPGPVAPVDDDSDGRGVLGLDEPRGVTSRDQDVAIPETQSGRFPDPVRALDRRLDTDLGQGPGDERELPDDHPARSRPRRAQQARTAVPREAVQPVRVRGWPLAGPGDQTDLTCLDRDHLDVVDRPVGGRAGPERLLTDRSGCVPQGRAERQ